jgi:hypothetical protein
MSEQKKKPLTSLSSIVKEARKLKPSQKQIDELNKILNEEPAKDKRQSAHPPEVES